MIQTYEHRMPLDGRDYSEASTIIAEHGARMVRIKPFLLDVSCDKQGEWIHILLRLTDIEQSRISVNARKTVLALARHAGLHARPIQLRQVLTEPTRRSFVTGEGRTPRARRPKSREPQTDAQVL